MPLIYIFDSIHNKPNSLLYYGKVGGRMAVIKNQFTLRLDLKISAKMKKVAQSESRSMTNMIEYILKKEIKRYEEINGVITISDEDLYLE